jgi:peptidoglycan/xylan/chitin deacetylase (PgdA/CDA1 family)
LEVKYAVLKSLGMTAAFRWLNRKRVAIALLHGVGERNRDDDWAPTRQQLSPSLLEEYLEVLARYYSFVSLDDAVAMIRGDRKVQPNCIAFTIDDGYRNSIEIARPIFRKYGVEPTIFVTTGMMNGRSLFWHDRLDEALQRAARHSKSVSFDGRVYELNGESTRAIEAVGKAIIRTSRTSFANDDDRLRAIETLIDQIDRAHPEKSNQIAGRDRRIGLATNDEIRAFVESGGMVGSHSVTHRRLDWISKSDRVFELSRSKTEIEALTGEKCSFFCYPEGSFDDSCAEDAREAGYIAALTTDPGLNAVSDNLMKLKRFHLPGRRDLGRLLADASGLAEALHARKKRILG